MFQDYAPRNRKSPQKESYSEKKPEIKLYKQNTRALKPKPQAIKLKQVKNALPIKKPHTESLRELMQGNKRHLPFLSLTALIGLLTGWAWQANIFSFTLSTLDSADTAPPAVIEELPLEILSNYPLPETLSVNNQLNALHYQVSEPLQKKALGILDQYQPYLAVILVSDLYTGHFLAAAARDSNGLRPFLPLAAEPRFPAASLAKIITSISALENAYTPDQKIPQLGAHHTLYKNQIREPQNSKFPTVSLRMAFAKSINPAFGILGNRLRMPQLYATANKVGWNKTSLPLLPKASYYPQDAENNFLIAELSSGFTRNISLSTLHALTLAKCIGSDGIWSMPGLVRDIQPVSGPPPEKSFPQASDAWVQGLVNPESSDKPVLSNTVQKNLQILFQETVNSGTAARFFRRNLGKALLAEIEAGGKTGSLDGTSPPGRCDWYIGYARLKNQPQEGLALAVLQVHHKSMNLRSAEMAALLIKDWGKVKVASTLDMP